MYLQLLSFLVPTDGTRFAQGRSNCSMVCDNLNPGGINVLVNEANWAWPMAMKSLFEPRGVNMLLARCAGDVMEIVRQRRIHTAIVDIDSTTLSGLGVVRILKEHNPLLPCILLAETFEEKVLKKALELDVFSVIGKPVDFELLRKQLDRLFVRRYQCDIFGK
jgi:DNA-binding NtrC family response regulator